jgi:hypothetical protein
VSGAPRRRIVVAALGLVAIGPIASGCGGDAAAVSASLGSPPRPAPEVTTELPPELSIPDVSIPDGIPGADELQQCVDLTEAYSEAVVLAFSGDEDGRLPSLFDQLAAAAPADVRDDLATLEQLATEAAEGGLLDATGTVLGDEFNEANTVVVDWLAAFCSGEGG